MLRTKATFSVPPKIAPPTRVQKAARGTPPECVPEALRTNIKQASNRSLADRIAQLPEEEPTPDELAAIEAGRADMREGRLVPLDRLRHRL